MHASAMSSTLRIIENTEKKIKDVKKTQMIEITLRKAIDEHWSKGILKLQKKFMEKIVKPI